MVLYLPAILLGQFQKHMEKLVRTFEPLCYCNYLASRILLGTLGTEVHGRYITVRGTEFKISESLHLAVWGLLAKKPVCIYPHCAKTIAGWGNELQIDVR